MDDPPDYLTVLGELERLRPRVARRLHEADRLRATRLGSYLEGQRLAGLEQLFSYLEALHDVFQADEQLVDIAFLVTRVIADFETAIEATLSGYQGVACDAMRDVMEIEYLTLSFFVYPDDIQDWLNADRRMRLKKFAPGKVRDRIAAAGVRPFGIDGWEPVDYRAHSEGLHVSPQSSPIGRRGIENDASSSILGDVGFIEMYEHAWRLLQACELLRASLADFPPGFKPLVPMDDFFDALGRTREMQVMLMAMLEGPHKLRKSLAREPEASEILQYIADAVAHSTPRRSISKPPPVS